MDPTNKNQKSDMIQLAKPTPPTLDFQSRGRLGEPTQGIISQNFERRVGGKCQTTRQASGPVGYRTIGLQQKSRRP